MNKNDLELLVSLVWLVVFAEPSYSSVVQLAQSVAAVRPLLHWPPALCSNQGAVPGDPHALHYHQVSAIQISSKATLLGTPVNTNI